MSVDNNVGFVQLKKRPSLDEVYKLSTTAELGRVPPVDNYDYGNEYKFLFFMGTGHGNATIHYKRHVKLNDNTVVLGNEDVRWSNGQIGHSIHAVREKYGRVGVNVYALGHFEKNAEGIYVPQTTVEGYGREVEIASADPKKLEGLLQFFENIGGTVLNTTHQ